MDILLNQFKNYMKKHGKAVVIDNVNTTAFFREYDEKRESSDYKYIFTRLGEIKQGSIVQALGKKWISISHIVNFNDVYEKSLLRNIQYVIKFVINGEIKEFATLIDTKILDVETDNYYNLATGKIQLTLQADKNSNKIKIDDRFIKMDSAWKVVGVDKSKDGLIILTCDKDLYNAATDDVENEIANKNKLVTYSIVITNSETEIEVDKTLQITAKTYANGAETVLPVTYSVDDASIAEIDENGLLTGKAEGTVIITASCLEKNISITHTIQVKPVSIIIIKTVEIAGNAHIRWGRQATYTATFKENGISYANPCTFTLTGLDGKTTNLATITTQNSSTRSCVVLANNNNLDGYVVLHVTGADGSVGSREIEIRSFWL